MELQIGQGLGTVRFGMKALEVQSVIGTPDHIYTAEDSLLSFESEDCEMGNQNIDDWFSPGVYYQYDKERIRLFFSEEESDRLCDISTSNSSLTLFGVSIIGLSLNELLDLCKEYGGAEIELDEGAHMTLYLYVESWQITFTLEYDFVTSVSFGPFWKDDESYLWPEASAQK